MLLLFVCRDGEEPAVLTARMVITQGAVFSEELNNSSSLLFKALAFDVQTLVRPQAFILKVTGSFNPQPVREHGVGGFGSKASPLTAKYFTF